MFCEGCIQDMELTDALKSLMALFAEHISMLTTDITACIKSKVTDWIASQARFIQALFAVCRYRLGKLNILDIKNNCI